MGFLKRLFGGSDKKKGHQDPNGIYLYVQCDNCGSKVRLRADKQYDLNRTGSGFVWHKTIMDSKCFRKMPAVVHFDKNYMVANHEITGGQFISEEIYNMPEPVAEEEE